MRAQFCELNRGILVLGGRSAPQSEVIRAILMDETHNRSQASVGAA